MRTCRRSTTMQTRTDMLKSIFSLLIILLLAGLTFASEKVKPDRPEKKTVLTDEEKEILKNREILENLHLLQNLHKIRYLELLTEIEADPPKEKDSAKAATKKDGGKKK